MAQYTVTLSSQVDFAPSDEVREILQNVRTILSTRKGSVPLDRDFGLTWAHIDKPMPVAKMLMRSEVIDAIEDIMHNLMEVSVSEWIIEKNFLWELNFSLN